MPVSGAVFTVNGQSVHVFDATSFNNNGTSDVLTINGSASDLVAINLDGLGNIQFHGGIAFTGGIGPDNVVFNVGGGNYTTMMGGSSLDINNNGGAAGIARGIFLDPNGAISVTNAVINQGRVFGGDAHDFQFVSGSRTFHALAAGVWHSWCSASKEADPPSRGRLRIKAGTSAASN